MSHQSAGHTRTSAVVMRVGPEHVLLSLPEWFQGVVLARALTSELVRATGRTREQLRGAALTVAARLDAAAEDELDLRDWRPGSPDAYL